MKDTAVTTGSGGALFLPWWIEWLPNVWQFSISLMAGAMLILGVYSKFLEIRQRRRALESPLHDDSRDTEADEERDEKEEDK